MYHLMFHLEQSAWEYRCRALSIVAFAVPVIVSKVADGAVAVLKGHRRNIPGHNTAGLQGEGPAVTTLGQGNSF
jgi:hypothetical protein